MCSHPALLEETCRAIAILPSQFIRSNLPRILPQLFANCEKAVLETISKELGTKLSILFVSHSHKILAYVFLQRDQTRKALQFILKTLEMASQGASIDAVSVIKSCLIPLLTELVIKLGYDNSNNVNILSHLSDSRYLILCNHFTGQACTSGSTAVFVTSSGEGAFSAPARIGRVSEDIHSRYLHWYQRHVARCPRKEKY